jgi:hypothetical protein
MCKFKIFVLTMIIPVSAFAGEDPSLFLNGVVDSFNEQDCVAYSSHFVESVRSKKRKESGLFFASNDSKMILKEHHVLADEEQSMEVAVAYSIDNNDYVSRIFLQKENESWKIDREVLVKKPASEYASSDYSAPQNVRVASQNQVQPTSNPFSNRTLPPQQAQNCPGGVCGGPKVPFSSLNACRDYGFDPIPCRNGSCSIK